MHVMQCDATYAPYRHKFCILSNVPIDSYTPDDDLERFV
jgi:hypothetical protein